MAKKKSSVAAIGIGYRLSKTVINHNNKSFI
jgi:hypothetical protein